MRTDNTKHCKYCVLQLQRSNLAQYKVVCELCIREYTARICRYCLCLCSKHTQTKHASYTYTYNVSLSENVRRTNVFYVDVFLYVLCHQMKGNVAVRVFALSFRFQAVFRGRNKKSNSPRILTLQLGFATPIKKFRFSGNGRYLFTNRVPRKCIQKDSNHFQRKKSL